MARRSLGHCGKKFFVRAKKKKYKKVIKNKVTVVPDTTTILDLDNDEDKKLKNQDLNENVYANLILLIDVTKATGRTMLI